MQTPVGSRYSAYCTPPCQGLGRRMQGETGAPAMESLGANWEAAFLHRG